MGLKDLKSNLDLQGGFGNEGAPLGEMENFTPQNLSFVVGKKLYHFLFNLRLISICSPLILIVFL